MFEQKDIKKNFKSKTKYIKSNWQLYIFFLLPAFAITLVFKYLPMGGILMAFKNYNPRLGIFGSEWIGLKNFIRFMDSPDFIKYLFNTLKLSTFGLLCGFPVPILIALLLNRIRSKVIKRNLQLVLYSPNFISVIVLCGMVFLFLSPVGPLNKLLGTNINFMALPDNFRAIYIISGIWQGAGWASILYTAALANTDQELMEAAVIDGASLLQQVRYVDLPTIKPVIVIQFILSAGNIMSLGFEKAFALQTSLNVSTSEIIPTYVYKLGLQIGDYSFSTAVGLFNSIINLILLLIVNQIVKKFNDNQGIYGDVS